MNAAMPFPALPKEFVLGFFWSHHGNVGEGSQGVEREIERWGRCLLVFRDLNACCM